MLLNRISPVLVMVGLIPGLSSFAQSQTTAAYNQKTLRAAVATCLDAEMLKLIRAFPGAETLQLAPSDGMNPGIAKIGSPQVRGKISYSRGFTTQEALSSSSTIVPIASADVNWDVMTEEQFPLQITLGFYYQNAPFSRINLGVNLTSDGYSLPFMSWDEVALDGARDRFQNVIQPSRIQVKNMRWNWWEGGTPNLTYTYPIHNINEGNPGSPSIDNLSFDFKSFANCMNIK